MLNGVLCFLLTHTAFEGRCGEWFSKCGARTSFTWELWKCKVLCSPTPTQMETGRVGPASVLYFFCILLLLFRSRNPSVGHNCKYSAVQKRILLKSEWETGIFLNKYLNISQSHKHLESRSGDSGAYAKIWF